MGADVGTPGDVVTGDEVAITGTGVEGAEGAGDTVGVKGTGGSVGLAAVGGMVTFLPGDLSILPILLSDLLPDFFFLLLCGSAPLVTGGV
jgi:hypothetical protein